MRGRTSGSDVFQNRGGSSKRRIGISSCLFGTTDTRHSDTQALPRPISPFLGMDEPDKPKGMHSATYNWLLDRAEELDDLGWIRVLGLSPL